MPEPLAAAINFDDHYLVKALLAVPGAILVTTDQALQKAVGKENLPRLWRDQFLQKYF